MPIASGSEQCARMSSPTASPTGKRAVIDELHHWVVRDGLAVRYRPYVDTAALIELFRP